SGHAGRGRRRARARPQPPAGRASGRRPARPLRGADRARARGDGPRHCRIDEQAGRRRIGAERDYRQDPSRACDAENGRALPRRPRADGRSTRRSAKQAAEQLSKSNGATAQRAWPSLKIKCHRCSSVLVCGAVSNASANLSEQNRAKDRNAGQAGDASITTLSVSPLVRIRATRLVKAKEQDMAHQTETDEVAMERAAIAGTSLEISRVAIGTWAIGGWMWGGTDQAESIATIRAAVEHGINLIDTAPAYGFGR